MQLDGLRILLAEDNPTNRVVAVQMLESLGATVAVAPDGTEALRLLEAGDFEVLLVDIEMPGLSGLEVIRHLAAEPERRPGLTVLALTAYATPDLQRQIREAGADGVITKPIVSIEQLGEDIFAGVARTRECNDAAPAAAQIDHEIYRGLAAAVGPTALGELLGKVDADISDAYDRMQSAISGGDMAELRAATHILIAVAGAIGATGLQGMSERLNRAAHESDSATIGSIGRSAGAEVQRVLGFVRRERG